MRKGGLACRVAQRFHNIRFGKKLLISYIVVGLLPMLAFCVYLCVADINNTRETAQRGFEATCAAMTATLKTRIERLENAVALTCSDTTVANVATVSYSSEYRKYIDVTGRFDSAMQTLLLMNPELVSYTLYLPNNLAGIRHNFISLESIKGEPLFEQALESVNCQWIVLDGRVFLVQRIFQDFTMRNYAVLQLEISYSHLFDGLGDVKFQAIVDGVLIYDSMPGTVYKNQMVKEEISFGGKGEIILYADRDAAIASGWNSLFLLSLALVAFLAMMSSAIVAFSNSFVRRIQRINDCVSQVVEQDFGIQLAPDYQDELGDLTRYINQMIQEARQKTYVVYRSEIKQREYEIKALQAQINPHFLYNTLSAINWHAIKSDNEYISSIVSSLSTFYRTALNKGESMTTVRNELENIIAYIDIQLRIHDHSFDAEYEIDESVYDSSIPNLVLQPVVENAIEHGIDQKESGRGKLKVRVKDQGDSILIQITDNGPGMEPEVLESLMTNKKEGYGLRNINKRLQLFYGEDCTMRFACDRGTTSSLTLPKVKK